MDLVNGIIQRRLLFEARRGKDAYESF